MSGSTRVYAVWAKGHETFAMKLFSPILMRSYGFSVFQCLTISHNSEHEKNMDHTNGQVPKYSFTSSLLDLNAQPQLLGRGTVVVLLFGLCVFLKNVTKLVLFVCADLKHMALWYMVYWWYSKRLSLYIAKFIQFETSTLFLQLLNVFLLFSI